MKKVLYEVIVSKRNDEFVSESHVVSAKNAKEAKAVAKALVPIWWKPVVREVKRKKL